MLVGGAGWALFTGLRAARRAERALVENRRLSLLVADAPAQAMLVRVDGRVEMPRRLADWFGCAEPPAFLADLAGGGVDAVTLKTLASKVTAAGKAGRPFTLIVRPADGARSLRIEGGPARRELGSPGGALLWVFDMTATAEEIARLDAERHEAEVAFGELTALIEAAPLPMWYRGPDLRLTMVNSAYAQAVEATSNRDAVTRGIELIEGAGVGGPLAGAVAARDSRQVQIQPMPATIRGERRMLRVFEVPMPDGGVAGFAMDIDELDRSRAWIRQFGDAQRGLLDRLSAGVAQFAPDRSLIFCNQPFRRLFALQPEWLADRPEFDRVLERMRETGRLPEVRDFPGWKAERREWFVAEGGAAEEPWHLAGGTHLRVVPQPMPDGGLVLIFEDRTEQVQLASARDTLLRVRTAMFDNLAEALGVFGADGRLQLWNNKFRALWEFDEELLATHPRVDTLAEAGARQLAQPQRAALIGELVRAATVERQQRAGRVAFADGRFFDFAAVPLPDGNGLFTMLDVTDSRRIEQALRERNQALEAADRIKTQFVANMSYELRTPLTSISGFAEMLKEGYAGPLTDAGSGYVAAILESSERLTTLVDEVLDLTDTGETPKRIERREVDLTAIARIAAGGAQPLAEARGIDFAVEVLPSTGRVQGDGDRLRQVIENLLRYTLLHLPERSRVLLHTDGTGDRARIVVSDDGPGMDAATAAAAFDRFAEPGLTRSGERSLGLELPLARQFVAAHGGTIRLASEPGEGTLVTVELPRR